MRRILYSGAEIATFSKGSFMKTRHSILRDLMVVALTIFGFASVTFAGGVATGGGSVCVNPAVNNGNPILLDLALSNQPDLPDNPYTGTRIRNTKVAEATYADRINLHKNRAYQYALARIQAWEKHPGSKYSMALVEEGLKSVQFIITPLRIKPLRGVYLPPGSKCQMSNLHTAILFDNGFLYISLPAWNRLGLLSQAGLLIHESLRNVQILQQLDGTDAELERLTAKILLPYDGITRMDAQPFFAKYISDGTSRYKADLLNVCALVKGALVKYPALKTYTQASDVRTVCAANLVLGGDISAVQKSLGKLVDGFSTALHTHGFQALNDRAFTGLTVIALDMDNMSETLAYVALQRTLYSGTDASTILNGTTYSMFPNHNYISALRGVPQAFNLYLSTCTEFRRFITSNSNEQALEAIRPQLQDICFLNSPQEVVSMTEANKLSKVVSEIDSIIESMSLPFTPFVAKLSNENTKLAVLANTLSGVIIENETYALRDAITGLSGAFNSVAAGMIRRYLNGEPVSYSPTIEARDERIIRRYIQVQRKENEQFLESGE